MTAHILVADDDEITRDMLEATLSGRYQVTTAPDGQSAIDLASATPFDLLILDVEMPGLDGYATCQALKSEPSTSDLPVIFLSGRVTLDERLRGYEVGANDYLTKPFDVSELINKIELAVSQRARNRALNQEIEDAQNSVMAVANLYGEMGVVFEMQRQLPGCKTYADVSQVFFDALGKLGLEGCLRLSGRQGVLSRTASAECSALENSILDHIEQRSKLAIEPLGEHTCIRYENVVMLIRQMPLNPDPERYSADDIDRFGRHRDNLALMAEAIVTYLLALDAGHAHKQVLRTQDIIRIARESLADVAAQQHANRMQLELILRNMTTEVEHSFIHLGLSSTQEDQLTSTLQRHIGEVMSVFSQVDLVEHHIGQIMIQLER